MFILCELWWLGPSASPFCFYTFRFHSFPLSSSLLLPAPLCPRALASVIPLILLLVLIIFTEKLRQGSRQNLVYNCNGEIVYPAACAGVVMTKCTPPQLHRQRFNLEHTQVLFLSWGA